jgi:glucose/arabinose dehydrogenase
MPNVRLPAALLLVAAAGARPAAAQGGPLETRPANGADQRPAFRRPDARAARRVRRRLRRRGRGHRAREALGRRAAPGGDLLVTEKPGRLRIVSASGQVGAPIAGLPAVDARGQGGLLDVALSPRFARDRTVYWSFSEPREGGNATSVARGVLSADRTRLDSVRVILRARPAYDGGLHFGSRLAFGTDGMLYVTLGDRSDTPMRPHAQRLDSHMGKILRVRPDGTAPSDNPFAGRAGALPEIWSLGHRNVQAAAMDASGRLWEIEHGTRGGDELNLVEKGKNYGWPLAAYGIEYGGGPIRSALGAAAVTRPGTEQPVYYWDPVIAPSGATFYTGAAFPQWRGNLFVGALGQQRLVRLVLDGRRVAGEEHLLEDRKQRVRDVRQGPDGLLYVVTDQGELWRIAPRR